VEFTSKAFLQDGVDEQGEDEQGEDEQGAYYRVVTTVPLKRRPVKSAVK